MSTTKSVRNYNKKCQKVQQAKTPQTLINTNKKPLLPLNSLLSMYLGSVFLRPKYIVCGRSTEGATLLAEPTKRSEVVAMVGTKWLSIDGSGSP